MKRKTILRILAIAALVAIVIKLNWPADSHASWGNTFRDRDGTTIKFHVYGYSSGDPIAGVLINLSDLDEAPRAFSWESKSKAGKIEFWVNGQLLVEESDFVLHLNRADGSALRVAMPKEQAMELFGRDANPTQLQLLEYWKRHADP